MDNQPIQKSGVEGLSRRALLRRLTLGAGAIFLGCRRQPRVTHPTPSVAAPATAHAAVLPSCLVRPEQTEGPYFIDERLNRSDIRSDPSDGAIKPGVHLTLAFHVSRISGASCSPLSNAIVDVWQCDALGVYSGVRDGSVGFDTRGKKFLRGYQTTDVNGTAEFLTIYPGWYPGRAVHIHFKIRGEFASGRHWEFTSQLYFDESVTDQVHQQAPYISKGRRHTTNDGDFAFRRGGKQLMPSLAKNAQGYTAKFDIGLQMS